jgi:iron complex outermembrane receptor protein
MNKTFLNTGHRTSALSVIIAAACSSTSVINTALAEVAQSTPVEEVLVSARKRSESSLDVPIALSVFDQTLLNSPLLDNISDLGSLSPNVDFNYTTPLSGSSNSASVFIRGVGQNDFLLTSDPGVGIYLDGVYIARSIGGVLQLADVERVEILRGPQGTLFGKNTIGGAVQVISRKPSRDTAAHITATTGKYHRQGVKASIEGAIHDNAQLRVTVQSERRDGYADRLLDDIELGDIDRQAIAAKLVWQSNDNTEWDLSLDHSHQRQEAIAQTILEMDPTFISGLYNALVAGPQGTAWDERWITGDPFTTFQTGPSEDDADISGASLSVTHQGSAFELTSITGYRRLSADYARDPDNSPLQYGHSYNHDQHQQFSQEFRLTGSALQQRLDWLAGIYYFREHGKNLTEGFLFSGLYQASGNNPMLDTDFNVNNDIITDSSAVFTQLTGHITDNFNATFGLRYSREEKEFMVNNFTLNAGIPIVGPITVDDSWNNSSPMISLDYHLNPDTMVYFSASKGFKSGGFNGRQIFPGPVDKFDPESATSFELGIKSRLKSLGANLEAAIFSVDYKDMQFTTLLGSSFGLLPVIDNAAKADIDGVELSLVRNAKQGLSYNTGLGYLHARYDDVDASTVITGNEDLVRTPEWNAHLQLAYSWPIADAGQLELASIASYKSKIYHDPTNLEALSEDGMTLVNASLGWTSQQADWQIELFVTNLTDQIYLLSGSTEKATFGGTEGYYARPREWGLRVSANF